MPTPSGHTQAIRAKTVIGASVKDPSGEQLGKVEDVILDKLSNNIMFAVIGFGGVLGIGEKFHPVPWAALDFDEDENAYVVSMTKDELKEAPADTIDALTEADGAALRTRVYDYYGVDHYWN